MNGDRYVRGNTMMFDRTDDRNDWSVGHITELVVHIVLVALFVWAVVMVVRYTVKYLNTKSGIDMAAPEDIAKKRFAAGEITKTEYEQLKKDLK